MSVQCAAVSPAKLEKVQVQQSSALAISQVKEGEARYCGQLFSQLFHFTLMNYHLKVPHSTFRIHGSDVLYLNSLNSYSPKRSHHLVAADMSHTPAQNCLIELWSGASDVQKTQTKQIVMMKMYLHTYIHTNIQFYIHKYISTFIHKHI